MTCILNNKLLEEEAERTTIKVKSCFILQVLCKTNPNTHKHTPPHTHKQVTFCLNPEHSEGGAAALVG